VRAPTRDDEGSTTDRERQTDTRLEQGEQERVRGRESETESISDRVASQCARSNEFDRRSLCPWFVGPEKEGKGDARIEHDSRQLLDGLADHRERKRSD